MKAIVLEWDIGHREITCKVYATVIWMFNFIFVNNLQQAFDNNPWLAKLTKLQLFDLFITPRKMYVGDKQSESIFIGGSLMQKMA
jgi:hypothetical protein